MVPTRLPSARPVSETGGGLPPQPVPRVSGGDAVGPGRFQSVCACEGTSPRRRWLTPLSPVFQELCRQRMAVRTSDRPEAPHVSRVNSVSSQVSDGPMPSPCARSSTSSWSEEPAPPNMDISTGHMVLVRPRVPSANPCAVRHPTGLVSSDDTSLASRPELRAADKQDGSPRQGPCAESSVRLDGACVLPENGRCEVTGRSSSTHAGFDPPGP